MGRPMGIPMGRPMGRHMGCPMGRPMARPMGRPMGIPRGRPMGIPMGMPMGRPTGRPMARPRGIPMGRPMGIPMGIPMGRAMGRPMGRRIWKSSALGSAGAPGKWLGQAKFILSSPSTALVAAMLWKSYAVDPFLLLPAVPDLRLLFKELCIAGPISVPGQVFKLVRGYPIKG